MGCPSEFVGGRLKNGKFQSVRANEGWGCFLKVIFNVCVLARRWVVLRVSGFFAYRVKALGRSEVLFTFEGWFDMRTR